VIRCTAVIATIAASLSACATPREPQIVVREVRVPVSVPCAAKPPASSGFIDSPDVIAEAPDIFARVQALLAGRAQRDARIAELEAAVGGCS